MDLAGMKRRELQALCKRHGLPAGGSNADLVARLDAALSGSAGAEEEVAGVPARKGCLKQIVGDAADAKKVTFAAEEGKARRLRSRVIWSPIVGKTRGKSAQASTDSAAGEDSISAEVGANVPVRRSRRNSVSAAEAEEVGEAVAIDRKRKRKNQENAEGVAVSTQVEVSSRVMRRSSLAGPAAVLPPAVEKKRGRGKAAAGSNKLVAEVQDSEPHVQNSAQVGLSARITRSRAAAPVVMSPTVVENKRRKTGDARTNLELPTVADVPRNDAPVTRSLRSRVAQFNNSMVDETHTARQLENKTQPSRPPTRRHQQVSSSVEDKNQEQTAAPNKAPILKRSGRNHSEDAEKQPEVREPVKRSTRKSVVLATLEKEENDLIEEKNPEVHVKRSTMKSSVLVKDKNANSEDAVKQPATKGPVRGSRRKSVVSELHKKEKGLIAEKNTEAHEGRSMWKSVVPAKDIKAVVEGIQNAKGKDVEKKFVVKQPTRRSSRKSVLPDILENNSGLLAAEMNAEMNVRRSTRKSVLPNMLNEENQDHNKIARNENFQSGKCQDDERQQKVKEPIRRSRRSVVAVPFEEQNNGLYEEKISKIPMRRSTRKSVALNEVEKVSMDDTEIVALEPERVGEEGLKLRKHKRSSLEISSSANDSRKMEDFDGQKFRKQQNAQIPNEKGNTGGTLQASDSTTLKGRSSKRRRTTASEEVRSVKEANDDIIIREAIKDAHKATHENKESGSRVQEFGQVNATREEHSSGPLLVTVTLTEEISTAQSVPVVIPGSESGDNANEGSDKSKQEHSDIQAVDSHLSETSGELDQSSCIAGLVLHNFDVSEDKSLMSKGEVNMGANDMLDGLSIDFTVGDREEQSPVSGEGRVGLEANASEPGEQNLANVMSTGLHAKSQHDTDIIAEETDKDVLPMAFPIEEHGEKYAVSPVAVEKSVGREASACESAGKPLTGIFSSDLHTKHLQHDSDVLTKETGEASGAALPISEESDTNPEIQSNAEESIRAADLGKCPSRVSKGNPCSTSLHLESAADDCILPVLNADKGCSSDGRPSSFGLEFLFAEAREESYSKNIENTVGDCEEQSPISGEGTVGLEANASESGGKNLADIMSTGLYAKSLQHDTDIIGEEADKDVLPMAFPIEEHGEKYAVSPVAVEKSVGREASACESAGKPLTGIFSSDLHTKHLQHDSDVLTKETGEASGAALPISEESDTNPEIQSNAEESIRAADLGKCPSRVSKGNPCSTSLHLESAADDCILPVLNADKGCSSDGRPSSFGLEFLFAEAREESYSKNIENTVGDCEEQSPISGEGTVGLEANASESGGKNLADIMSTGLYAKSLQHDTDIIGEEADKDVLPMAFPIEEHGEKYAVSPVAVEKSVGREASACESAGKPLTGIFSSDLHTKHLQHDSDVLTKETGEASGAALPISEESDTNPEIQSNAEESIRAADLGKCPSRVSKGNPCSTSLHLESAADDCILPVLNADKGCSSDGRPSSFGLEFLFAEAREESYSKNIENTVGDCEEQSPISGEGTVGLEANASESGGKNLADIMSTGLYAKSLQHDTDIIGEEADKDVLPMAFPIEEHGEKYAVSPVAVEKSVGREASACESAGKPLTGIFSSDLHTKHLQHDSDVLTKETGEASGAALPISEESDTNPEIQSNAEESIRAADLGKCPSRVSKGNPCSTSLHLESAADDCILPVLNADKGCSSDGRPSSFGLEFLFAEAREESYSKNIENTVGDCEEQSPISGEGTVGLEANASESGGKNLADIMSTGLYAKSLQHDTDIIGEEADKDVLPMAFPIEEHGEKYAVSPVAVEKSVGREASACESAGKPLTGIFSSDLHTKHLQHDSDVLTKETGEASGAALPISEESDTNPEIQSNAEESIRAADLGKCPSRVSKGNPCSTSLHLESAADDCILPVLNADKGCSSDGRPSSFGLEFLFAEAREESYSKNIENTVGDCEEQSPISGEGTVGLEANASESGGKNLADIMSTGLYAKSLQHDTDIIGEEADKDVLPMAFPIEEHGEKYAVSPVAVEKSVGREASACESAGKPLTGIFSSDLHTKHLQHDSDVLTKETGEASGAALPISEESDTNPEIQSNAEESIRAADLGKCPSRVSKGNPCSTSLHLESAADDCILPVLNADKGCSSDGRPSSFGLEFLFAEAREESYSKNIENTVGDCEEQSPISGEGTVGLEANASESGGKNLADIMSTGLYAKSLQHDTDIIGEEADKDVLPMAFPIEEHGEKYAVSPVAVEKSVGREASACESAGKPLTGIFSNDLHTKHLQHDCDVLTKKTGEASGAAPPISESDTNPENQCNAEESIRAADLGKCPSRVSNGNPYSTSLQLEGAADDCILLVLNADKGCSSDGRRSSFGLELLFVKACKESYSKNIENTVGDHEEQSPISGEGRVGLEANASESGEKNLADIMSTGVYAKSLQYDTDIIAEETGKVDEKSIRAADLGKCPSRRSIGNPLSTSLHLEGAADATSLPVVNADKGCSSDGRPSSFDLELMFAEECKERYSRNAENSAVEMDGGNKPSTPVTPGFYVQSDCLEDEDVQPTECDADKKLDVDEAVIEEAQEKSNDQHVPAKTDLNMKLNDELAGPGTESSCSITEKNARLVADNLDEQAIILVQHGDVQEGDLKKPSPCSTTPECKHKCGLPEETVLPPKNTGSLSSAEQSPFGLESLFSQENIDESMRFGTAHTKNGFDDSKGCHVKSALENTLVSEPFSHHEGISKNDDRMHTSQKDHIMAGIDITFDGGNTAVEIDGGNKPSTPVTPGFYVRSDCLEDDEQPTECDADKKLDVYEGVAEEILAQEKSNDQHIPAKTDLNMKLNDELASPRTESGCSITEKNGRLVADILQQGDWQEGDLEKPSLCSAESECKHECDLPEETVLPSRNTGSLPSAEQSPFGLESLFSQESIDKSVGYGALASATAHTENGFDDSKGCHVKSALRNTHVSEPFSHDDTEEGISKNDDYLRTSQQDNGMEDANLDEERVLSVFSLDEKHINEVINFEEVACEGEGSKTFVHSEELKASSEKTNVNGPDGNACGTTDAVLSSALHSPANDDCEICLGSNTDVLHQGHNDQCSDDTEDIIEDASAKYIERGIVLLSGKERSNLKDGELNSKLEGYGTEFLNREASNLHKDDCMDLSIEDNHPNGLPAPRSPEQSAYFQNSDLGSINQLRAKLQSFKVSSTVKGSYIAMSAPRPKPRDSMSQSAIALLRNIENTPAVKAGHPVKPNADGKDSSRRALQPISGRPREH